MADIRIKDLTTTAAASSADDYIAVDGTSNGTRKLSAATPSFATSVTVPGVVGPTSTDLTLTGGSTGASLVLGQGANGGAAFAPKGTGQATVTNPTAAGTSEWQAYSATKRASFGIANGSFGGYNGIAANDGFVYAENGLAYTADNGTHRWNISTAEAMRVTTTRNLLIGTQTDMTGSGGLKIAGTTAATTTASGALIVAGGVGVSGAGYFGGALIAQGDGTFNSVRTSTGGNSSAYVANPTFGTAPSGTDPSYQMGLKFGTTGAAQFWRYTGTHQTADLTWATTGLFTFSKALAVTDTTPSTGSTSGALQVAGGIYAGAASVFEGTVGISNVLTLTQAGGAGSLTITGASNSGSNDRRIRFVNSEASGKTYDFVHTSVASGNLFAIYNVTDALNLMTLGPTGAATFAGTISPQQATTAGAPAYVKGAIYFDTTLNKLRVGGATAWETITSA